MTKRRLVCWGLFAALLLGGCASAPPVERALPAERVASIKDAEVYVVVPQKQPYALVQEVPPGAMGLGLLGYAMESYQNSQAYKAMQANMAPVVAAASDINLGRDLESELRKNKVFTSPEKIRFVALPEGDDAVAALVKSANKPWVVVVSSAYYLDNRYRVLTVGATVSLWRQGEPKAEHEFRTVYYSRPISAEVDFLVTPKLAPLWAKNNGELLRRHEAEGVREIANLIKIALVNRPSSLVAPTDMLEDFIDWDAMRVAPSKAKRVGGGNERAVLVDANGTLLSVWSSPTYASAGEGRRPLVPGMARIFLYHADGTPGFAPTIYVNGKSEGKLELKAYMPLDVRPGTHSVALKYEGDAPGASIARSQIAGIKPVTITTQAGQLYYVRYEGYRGVFTSSEALKTATAAQSEAEISPLSLRY